MEQMLTRSRLLLTGVLILGLASCIRTATTSCGDGATCPAGTECRFVDPSPALPVCVTAEQLAACENKADYVHCDAAPEGRCYGGACLPGGCGNRRVDLADPSVSGDPTNVAEACDDGNNAAGDGCSADCGSLEVCGNGIVDLVRGERCDDRNALSFDGCSSACADENPTWSPVKSNVMTQRYGYSLAYDSKRDRVVMFGGATADGFAPSVPNAETREWDGTRWRVIQTEFAPSPRSYAAMAYDAERDRMVLFGGANAGGNPLGDTWEWDGTRWTARYPPLAPSARSRGAVAYDPTIKRVVLHGGLGAMGTAPNTWEWTGTTWVKRGGVDPGGRIGAAMAFDPTIGKLVLFGGYEDTTFFDDTWIREPAGWRLVAALAPRPPARAGHAMATDPGTGHVVLLGGDLDSSPDLIFGPALKDVWSFDGATWTQRADFPAEVTGLGIAPLPARSELIAIAPLQGVTYALGAATWSVRDAAADPETPGSRADHVVAYDSARHRIVLFGNSSVGGAGETWAWDGRWTKLSSAGPPARQGAGMAYDPVRDVVVLFGGKNLSGVPLGDTWELADSTWTQRSVAGPSPVRTGFAMAYAGTGKILLFGGETGGVPRGDTWSLGATGAWTAIPTPNQPNRIGAVAAFDFGRNKLVMFGGHAAQFREDTLEWDGTAWADVSPGVIPSPRESTAMTYDFVRQRIVLVGGSDSSTTALSDVWEWDGTTWEGVAVTGALEPRAAHSIAFAPDGNGLLLYGGSGAGTARDHLRLHRGLSAIERCGRNDSDGDGLAACADPDCWVTCAPRCPPGQSCASPPLCGNGACANGETCASCPADCGPCPALCGDLVCSTGEICLGDCGP